MQIFWNQLFTPQLLPAPALLQNRSEFLDIYLNSTVLVGLQNALKGGDNKQG